MVSHRAPGCSCRPWWVPGSGWTVSEYPLGHDPAEVERLLRQSSIYREHSEHILRLAGLGPGMRVLDVGCGPGDLSMLAARLVGPSGAVLGVDASPAAVEVAGARCAAAGLANVSFTRAVLPAVEVDAPVHAVIGRLILMHLDDPVDAVRRLATLLRSGGLVVFQEFTVAAMRTVPESPLYNRLRDWVAQALRAAGRDPDFGLRLADVVRRAGLGTPRMTYAAPIGLGGEREIYDYAVDTMVTLLPAAERFGLRPPVDLAPDTLGARLAEQGGEAGSVVLAPAIIGAWARLPR
jgi:SAM-dependent methyltransferase